MAQYWKKISHSPILLLDLVGQARTLLTYAGEVEGKGRTEDDLAYLRQVREYRNCLLLEQENGDFARTIVRQFLFDSYHVPFFGGASFQHGYNTCCFCRKIPQRSNLSPAPFIGVDDPAWGWNRGKQNQGAGGIE